MEARVGGPGDGTSELTWRSRAACGGATHLFYEEGEDASDWRSGPTPQMEAALAVCGSCPVDGECLMEALEKNERDGIWGRTTPRDRAAIRRLNRRRKALDGGDGAR